MKQKSLLTIENFKSKVLGRAIINGISLVIRSGEIHAVMGPNGSGKSTLAYSLMNHPAYVSTGSIRINSTELMGKTTEVRAKAGLYLALQTPTPIPGVSVVNLLRSAYQPGISGTGKSSMTHNPLLSKKINNSLPQFLGEIKEYAKSLEINEALLTHGIHDGASGGEKKKLEMLQALVLKPKFAVFDEIDTGLDVDALAIVSKAIKNLVAAGTGVLVITHYQRILKYIKPDVVHILVNGKIVKTGPGTLAREIEEKGYRKYESSSAIS